MGDMVLSSFLFALMAAGAKMVGAQVPTQEVVGFRGLFCVLITLWWLRIARQSWRGRRPGILFLRGLLGHVALSCYLWSVNHLPLAEAVLIQQVHPVFTAALAHWFLHERPGRRFWPGLGLAVAGVALIARPRAGGFELGLPALIGLCGSFCSGAAYVAVRDASRTEHRLTIVLWFPLVSFILALPGMAVEGAVVPQRWDWAWLVLLSAAGQFGQVFLVRGLARVPAGRATLANPLVTAFGALLGWALFRESLTLPTLAGGVLLIGAVLLARQGSPPDKSEKKN